MNGLASASAVHLWQRIEGAQIWYFWQQYHLADSQYGYRLFVGYIY